MLIRIAHFFGLLLCGSCAFSSSAQRYNYNAMYANDQGDVLMFRDGRFSTPPIDDSSFHQFSLPLQITFCGDELPCVYLDRELIVGFANCRQEVPRITGYAITVQCLENDQSLVRIRQSARNGFGAAFFIHYRYVMDPARGMISHAMEGDAASDPPPSHYFHLTTERGLLAKL